MHKKYQMQQQQSQMIEYDGTLQLKAARTRRPIGTRGSATAVLYMANIPRIDCLQFYFFV